MPCPSDNRGISRFKENRTSARGRVVGEVRKRQDLVSPVDLITVIFVLSATIDVKKTIFDLCTDVTDSFVAVIEVSLAQIILTPFNCYCVRCGHYTETNILIGWERCCPTW